MRFWIFLPLWLFTISSSLKAQDWVEGKSGHSKARLISQLDSVAPGTQEILVSAEIRLDPGWHTYWKNPGTIGLAPSQIEWKLPPSWLASEFLFPVPAIFFDEKLQQRSFGYKELAYYLSYLSGPSVEQDPFEAELSFHFLICKESCIPESYTLKLSLPLGSELYSEKANRITEKLGEVPTPTKALTVDWPSNTQFRVSFLEENIKEILLSAPGVRDDFWVAQKLPEEEALKAGALSQFDVTLKSVPENLELTGLIESDDHRIGITASISQTRENAFSSIWPADAHQGFALALLFAFLGGLILNLMPCVLPVLFIKANSILRLRENLSSVRISLFLTISGILVSFVALGVLTALLRTFGHSVGWGFQFQNAGFISFMTLVIYLFALNLFGLFEVQAPASWNRAASERSGAFFEGVFATLLATPCSAPFLGTALTYALSTNLPTLLAMFLTMGMGLALPYLIFAVQPEWVRYLPRPGAWMNRVKSLLAYALLITALWLLSILLKITGAFFFFVLLAGLLIVFLFIKEFKSAFRWALVAVLSLSLIWFSTAHSTSASLQSAHTQDLSIERAYQLPQTEEAYFLFITADWCLTCKYNERFVIETDWFQEFTTENQIAVYRVDWTNQDARVAEFLDQYDRVGIPFALFGWGEGFALLPELMTRANTETAWNELIKAR